MSSKAQKLAGYPLPETIETEETQSFCVIIPEGEEYRLAMFAQLTELGKWWKWKRDEDRPTAASDAATQWRTLLEINEDCGGGAMPDPVDTYEAIKLGIYDAFNDLAKQIVSGRTTDIMVGSDGTVSTPTTGQDSVEIPEDDAATSYDDSKAAIFGGVHELVKGLELLLDRVDNYYGNVNGSPAYPAADAKLYIKLLLPCDAAEMDTAIDDYYTYRATTGQLVFNSDTTAELYIYCEGYDEAAWRKWLVDQSGFNSQKITIINTLTSALSDEFWTKYFERGIDTPSTLYIDADCEPVETQSFTLVPFSSARSTTAQKRLHRIRVTVEGYSTDTDGDLQDFFWYVNGTTGVRTRQNPTLTHGTALVQPSDNQVLYNAAHKYIFTLDLKNAANTVFSFTANKNGGMSASASNPNFSVTVEDLGQVSG